MIKQTKLLLLCQTNQQIHNNRFNHLNQLLLTLNKRRLPVRVYKSTIRASSRQRKQRIGTNAHSVTENTTETTAVEHRDEQETDHLNNAIAQRQPTLIERFLNTRPMATLRNFRIPRIRFEYD